MTKRFPEWIRRPWPNGADFGFTKNVLQSFKLNTVCQSAQCPNLGECWSKRTATVMVLGNTCTRNCAYCSVHSGAPGEVDPLEPQHVAESVRQMGLRHAVITTVVRDDLEDQGARHIADTVRAVRALNPETTVEVLIADFSGDQRCLDIVLEAEPEVFGHNIETVRRLFQSVRDRRFAYDRALTVLRHAAQSPITTIVKSAFMVGHGETRDDVRATLADLRDAQCDAVCIGQYLQPTPRQRDVAEFVHPETFKDYEAMAYEMGFQFAVAGPFVRSSYRSEELLETDFARQRLGLKATA